MSERGDFGTANIGAPRTNTREEEVRAASRVLQHVPPGDVWEVMMALFNPGKPAVVGTHGQTKWRGDRKAKR
jgi:hypothetical protein